MSYPIRSTITRADLRMKQGEKALRITQPGQLAYVPELEGMVYHENGEFQFDNRLYTVGMGQNVVLHAMGALVDDSLPFKLKGGMVEGSADEMALINDQHSLRKLEAGDVRIFERFVINDQPTRGSMIFTKAALKKFAKDFDQGRTVLMFHDTRKPVGRTFKASTVKATIREVEGMWVKLRLFIPVKDEDGQRIEETRFPVSMLGSGVLAFDSIGFGGGRIEGIHIGEGKNERFFLQVDDNPNDQFRLEAGETSFVFMGQVRGAGNNKQELESGGMPDLDIVPGDPAAGQTEPTTQNTITRWVTY